ncbi:Probable glycosyltransferase [Mycobacteroides abscessus subsp. abscessus]|nr:Probable glycosyltransferase [Mycobacteroides abscessus subsp. abscessus]
MHVELVVLVTANLVATLARFLGLRWVFRNPPAATPIRTGRTGAAR